MAQPHQQVGEVLVHGREPKEALWVAQSPLCARVKGERHTLTSRHHKSTTVQWQPKNGNQNELVNFSRISPGPRKTNEPLGVVVFLLAVRCLISSPPLHRRSLIKKEKEKKKKKTFLVLIYVLSRLQLCGKGINRWCVNRLLFFFYSPGFISTTAVTMLSQSVKVLPWRPSFRPDW